MTVQDLIPYIDPSINILVYQNLKQIFSGGKYDFLDSTTYATVCTKDVENIGTVKNNLLIELCEE